MPSNKNIFWVRPDVLNNSVSLFEQRMQSHISKHAYDKYPTDEEHIYQAITNPDQARRSLDPIVGDETCVYEKFFPLVGPSGQRFFTFVLYDEIKTPGQYDEHDRLEYELGGLKGKVSSAYFPGDQANSKHIGEVFWTKQEASLPLAASADDDKKESK